MKNVFVVFVSSLIALLGAVACGSQAARSNAASGPMPNAPDSALIGFSGGEAHGVVREVSVGVPPAGGFVLHTGRFFFAADTLGSTEFAIISIRLHDRLSGGSDLVGRTIFLNGRPITVIGVAEAGSPDHEASLVWMLPRRPTSSR